MLITFLKKLGIFFIFSILLTSLTEAAEIAPSTIVREGAFIVWEINSVPIWRFPAAYSGEIAEMSQRFNNMHKNGFRLEDLKVSKVNGGWSLSVGKYVLFSPLPEHSGVVGYSSYLLSLELMSRIYEAVGSKNAHALSPKYQIRGKYNISGLVSWYGGKLIGRKFANGERFTESHLTAAAKDLPFGTLVKITTPSTGKSVVVRITDRFKEHKNRVLDVSHAAAELLGIKREGIASAQLKVIGKVGMIGGD
ncbi:MAG: septal ring lytic transglycosylase RlpA family protein [Synergistaceae bacterium]|nr:septal ring lytic transglycosylase RlpA family protein [Synergistaceae bacterium]